MAVEKALAAHPRLYIHPEAIARTQIPITGSFWQGAEAETNRLIRDAMRTTTFPFDAETHNALLLRARGMQRRAVALLLRYCQTNKSVYRDAALRHAWQIGDWEYWSWIAWRKGDSDPNAIFDLSYGENSTTLALIYDLLHATLNHDEKKRFIKIAQRRSIRPFLSLITSQKNVPGWFCRPDTNWNTVCTGGAGMLALAMYEDLPEAAQVLGLVEESFAAFMNHLKDTDGGCVEGLGYWNYGMRYAFM